MRSANLNTTILRLLNLLHLIALSNVPLPQDAGDDETTPHKKKKKKHKKDKSDAEDDS